MVAHAGLRDDCSSRRCHDRLDGYSGESNSSGLFIRSDGNQIISQPADPPICQGDTSQGRSPAPCPRCFLGCVSETAAPVSSPPSLAAIQVKPLAAFSPSWALPPCASQNPTGTRQQRPPTANIPDGIRTHGALAPTLPASTRHAHAADASSGRAPTYRRRHDSRRSLRSICNRAPGRPPTPHSGAEAERTVLLPLRSLRTRSKEFRRSEILPLTVAVSYLATSYRVERGTPRGSCGPERKLMLERLHPVQIGRAHV